MFLEKMQNNNILIGLLLSVVVGSVTAWNYKISLLFLVLLILTFLFIMFISGRFNLYHYVLFMIPSILLSPAIPTGVGPAVRLDDLFLVFGGIILLVKIGLSKMRIRLNFNKPVFFYLSFIFLIVISILISSFREPYFYSNRDWFEVIKNVKLLVVFVMALNLKLGNKDLKRLMNTITASLFIASLLGITQYFNLLNVNQWLSPYFTYETQMHSLLVNDRIISTFGNPNVFAGMLLLGIAISLTRYLNEFKFRHAIPMVVFFLSLFMTQSRTSLIAAGVLTALIIMMSFVYNKRKFKVLFYSLVFSVFPIISLSFAPEKFFYRISFLGDLSTDNSFQARLNIWREIYQTRVQGNFIFGTGPLSKLHYYFDNEWLMLLTTYGLMGILFFLLLFGSVYINLRKIRRNYENTISQYAIAFQALLISYGVYMLTLAVFQQLQMMPIIMLSLGIILSIGINRKPEKINRPKKRIRIVW